MTRDDILKRHQEELSDAEHYEKMANECPEYHQIFMDIAHEERCHARNLEYVLEHKIF